MCRGLAILYDKNGKIICNGLSSHSETAVKSGVEDSSLKFEVIVTNKNKDGYLVVIDHQYVKGNNNFKEASLCLPTIKKWVKDNELQVLRYLLHTQSYAEREGDTYNSYQETEGNTYNRGQKTKGNTYNRSQETEGNTYNSYQKTKGNTNNSYQETEGNTYNSYQETEGDTYNRGQKTKGNTYNSYQKTKGNTNNSYQETEGDTYNRGQKTKGNTNNSYQETGEEWYMGKIELKKYPVVTELVSMAKDSWDLTLPEYTKWVAENHELVLKKLGEKK